VTSTTARSLHLSEQQASVSFPLQGSRAHRTSGQHEVLPPICYLQFLNRCFFFRRDIPCYQHRVLCERRVVTDIRSCQDGVNVFSTMLALVYMLEGSPDCTPICNDGRDTSLL
jgi:hypothetical protein